MIEISCHSLQVFTPLSKEEYQRLVQAVKEYNELPDESDEPWEDVVPYEPDPYWQWYRDKKHYHVEDYSVGVEATAYHGKHGYFIEFILHLDRLLYGADSHQLPTPYELSRVREEFAWQLFLNGWLNEVLQLPSWEQDINQEKRLGILRHFYDRLKVQRIDPAINIPNLSKEAMRLYSRVLNSGSWNNDKRQHFTTIENTNEPYPKTFKNACALEVRAKARNGEKVTAIRMNCYDKKAALLNKAKDPKKLHKPTNKQISNAQGIYRLEVQVWQLYIESLRNNHLIASRAIADVLTADFSAMILIYYIHQFAGDGDYYTLSTAKKKIKLSKRKIPSEATREKLCTFLELLHDTYNSNEDMLPLNEAFRVVADKLKINADTVKEYRKQLLKLNINPVTLPNNSSIKCLKNPLQYVIDYFSESAEQEERLVSKKEKAPAELYEASRSGGIDIDDSQLPF